MDIGTQAINLVDKNDFIEKAQACYDKYGFLPLKYRDKSGITLDSSQVLELATKMGLIQKH